MKAIKIIAELIRQYRNPVLRDALEDPRDIMDKDKDYVYGEDVVLAGSAPGKRVNRPPFTVRQQGSTSACGAFSAANLRRLNDSEITYELPWYRKRSNFANPGMFTHEVLKLAAHASSVSIPRNSPEKLTESFANSLPFVDLWDKNRKQKKEYFRINPFDVDAVVAAVSNGIPTLVSFYCTLREWTFEMIPRDAVTQFTAPVRHFVVALPNSLHRHNGQDWITVIDSSPQGGHSLRHIRLDFLRQRMWIGGGFVQDIKTKKKKVTVVPTERCQFGQRNENVRILQQFLFEQGLIAEHHRTGYYGNITSAAVLQWQLTNLGDTPQLRMWGGRFWGPASINRAKQLHW